MRLFCFCIFPSFFFSWISLDIDVVSKLTVRYAYIQFRLLERGLKMNVRLISTHASWSTVRT